MENTKLCNKCKQYKTLDEFYKNPKTGGKRSQCKKCMAKTPKVRVISSKDDICSVDGCINNVTYVHEAICNMHYNRRWKSGSFDLTKNLHKNLGNLCLVENCVSVEETKGLCRMHYARLIRTGSPLMVRSNNPLRGADHPFWVGENASYEVVHARLYANKGMARQFMCVDCGSQAMDWSYNNSDPNQLVCRFGAYSLDLENYGPRCRGCHQRFDRSLRSGTKFVELS